MARSTAFMCGERADKAAQAFFETVHPAYAGNARWKSDWTADFPVHPCVCGGTLVFAPRFRGPAQFIPACAGNAPIGTGRACPSSVHPRVCGERSSSRRLYSLIYLHLKNTYRNLPWLLAACNARLLATCRPCAALFRAKTPPAGSHRNPAAHGGFCLRGGHGDSGLLSGKGGSILNATYTTLPAEILVS